MPVPQDSNPTPSNSNRRGADGNLLWWLLMLLLLFNLGILPLVRPRTTEVMYSDFLRQVEQGEVAKVLIADDEIRYSLKPTAQDSPPADGKDSAGEAAPGLDYVTLPPPNDSTLIPLLEAKGVEYGGVRVPQGGWGGALGWLLLPLLFFALWGFLLSRGGAGPAALTVGKSKARIYSEGSTGVNFSDVAGVDEAKEELQEIIDFLKKPGKYVQIGAKIPKGVLLVGPPGTGKTLLARAVAGEANVPFYSISGSEFVELFVGVGAARVRDLFDQAKHNAPCIVFIDELDALGKARGNANLGLGRNDEQEQTLNQLLTEMDGFEANSGVLILAATNRPEVLDPALLRPGRFDRQVLVDRPDKLGRQAILEVHTRRVKLASDVDLASLAARTSGFTGADLANLVNEAALLAARQEKNIVSMAEFGAAFERVIAGLEKKSRVLNQLEKTIIAHHEVGHAIVGSMMPGGHRVEKISIIPRGISALGYTLQLPEEDRFLMVEDELRGRMATLLAGRSAEELIFGKVSTGASDDLQKATDLAERAVTLYGMSPQIGPVVIDKSPQTNFLEGWQSPRRVVGPEVTETVDREVKRLLEEAHQVDLNILSLNQALLKDAAQHLLQQEVLEGEALQNYLQRVQIPPQLAAWLESGDGVEVPAPTER
ncbi:MAG TPA: ATP-dependent zinc metalloprotease FtsH [Leptolyngbyaceae cyanobacterium M65_K2018_010]|nr:ATP-dependent zinc metalloprotease FtsH [Leptolyngbyaceae cyanobacterium M65_K2018_010]